MNAKHEWMEDDFRGIYEIVLIVDTGTQEGMLELSRLLREYAKTLPALGYRLEVRRIVGAHEERLEGMV